MCFVKCGLRRRIWSGQQRQDHTSTDSSSPIAPARNSSFAFPNEGSVVEIAPSHDGKARQRCFFKAESVQTVVVVMRGWGGGGGGGGGVYTTVEWHACFSTSADHQIYLSQTVCHRLVGEHGLCTVLDSERGQLSASLCASTDNCCQ